MACIWYVLMSTRGRVCKRLAKYGRRGFRVAVPGLIPSRIDIRLFACKERDLTGA